MKRFKKVLHEINYTIGDIFIFEEILNAMLIFLGFYLVFSFFGYYPFAAMAPAIAYLIFFPYLRLKQDRVKIIESKYDIVKEKLRTARDNKNIENPVVEELQKEVVEGMKQVRVSSFIDGKKISLKVIMIMVVCFIIVLMALLNLDFAGISSSIDADQLINRTILKGKGDLEVYLNVSDDIYGKESIAILGDEELSIKIKPSSYKVSVREGGDIERRDFDETFPSEVFVETATVYEENIPKEQQELVKNYFEKLSGG